MTAFVQPLADLRLKAAPLPYRHLTTLGSVILTTTYTHQASAPRGKVLTGTPNTASACQATMRASTR
jgi:hypothetical protein